MRIEKAGFADVDALTTLRLEYLIEDNGSLEHSDAEMIRNNLPGYIREHLKKDLFAYVIREDDTIVSCAFLLIVMKPMSPAFINGKTATVLNVYTLPAYRRRGYARMLMNAMIADAKELNIDVIELKATADGYDLYRSVGFEDDRSKYHLMKWKAQRKA
jgi:ribosomal protein S18 acetylase RimI-like enzyme